LLFSIFCSVKTAYDVPKPIKLLKLP